MNSLRGRLVIFYYVNRVFHILKRDIRHNAVAQVKYKAIFAFHPFEEAINAVFYYGFIGIQNVRVQVTLNSNPCR